MTTPQPVYRTDAPVKADDRPAPMLTHEKVLYRKAACLAARVYPGPVGQLLAADLLAMEEFGCRVVPNSLMWRVREQVLEEWRKREDARSA